MFAEDMIEEHRINVQVLLEASLKEVTRNTNTWNTLYTLGLTGHASTPEAVTWSVGNCIIAARTVRADTAEVYLIVARRQPGYVWVNGFHPDEPARAVWNRLAQLWMQAKWSQWVRPFYPQDRVISKQAEDFVKYPANDLVMKSFIEYTLQRESTAKQRRMSPDQLDQEVNFRWLILRRDVDLAYIFRREQEATPDLSNEEMVTAFLSMLQTDESKELPEAPPAMPEVKSDETPECFVFRKQGEMWRVVDGTGQELLLKDMKGFGYIAYLLRHPRRLYRILELVSAVEGALAANDTMSLANFSEQELDEQGMHMSEGNEGMLAYDQMTKEALAKELEKLNADRARAEADQDHAELERINRETKQIADYLSGGQGLGGRIREEGSDADSERSRVWHAVSDTILKIGQHNPNLAKHLKESIRIQIADSEYKPATPVTWHT